MAWTMFKIRFILLPLLCVVWRGSVCSEAQGTYQVPIVNVPTNPYEALYQYPMEGNGFKANGTHVFWPAYRKLYSKFYVTLAHEGEKLFGISQQIFLEQEKDVAGVGATMGANDHLAFVKVEGPWNDGTTGSSDDSNGQQAAMQAAMQAVMDQKSLEERLEVQRMKLDLYFKWYSVANISGLLGTQIANPAQIPALLQMPYNPEYEKKLLAEMDDFSSDLSHTDYQQFDKSAMMCLHINPGAKATKEEDGATGWWVPLERNIIGWRAMSFQQPISALRVTTGLVSLRVDDSGNLNAAFQGSQLWRSEVDGPDYKNLELHVAPPNAVTHNIPDIRPQPPALPMEPFATQIREAFKALPNDNNLPWMPRDQLCPQTDYPGLLVQMDMKCGPPFNPYPNPFTHPECRAAFINFYPCLNFYLRPSKKHNHGMDTINEFTPVMHAINDFPPVFIGSIAGAEIPWDDEFEQAMNILGLGA